LWMSRFFFVAETCSSHERYEQLQGMRSDLQFLFDIYRNTSAAEFLKPIEGEDVDEIDELLRELYDNYCGAEVPQGTPDHHWWWTDAGIDGETASH